MRKIILITALLALIAGYSYFSSLPPSTSDSTDSNSTAENSNQENETTNEVNFIDKLIPSKDYSAKQIPSQSIQASLTNLPEEAQDDCVAILNGETQGGDLISTLITNQSAREKAKLKNYTPDYLKELEYLITQDTGINYQSDFYAFKTCNIAPKLDVVAGYLWPKGQPTINPETNSPLAGFEDKKALVIVDNNNIFFYDNVDTLNTTATGAEVLPCKASIEGNDKVRWACFKGLQLKDNQVVGDRMREYLFSLSGEPPKVWEGIKNIQEPTPLEEENTDTLKEDGEQSTDEETNTPEETTNNEEVSATPPITAPDSIAARSQKEQIKFNSCGRLSLYFTQPWYKELEQAAARTKVDLTLIHQACHSSNGDILSLLQPGGYGQFGEIYRYDILTQSLERANIDNKDREFLAAPDKFGKRVDNVILLSASGGDGGCGGTYNYEYDFVNNVIELKQTTTQCEGDPAPEVKTY